MMLKCARKKPSECGMRERSGSVWWGGVACVLGLWACSPTFNWRQVRADGSAVAVLLPCKPERALRQVAMAGHPVALSMLSCDVGELTFALGSAQVPQGLSTAEVLQAWRQASLASMRAPVSSATAWTPTLGPQVPNPDVQGWKAVGSRPDGRPVAAQAVQMVHSTEVVQLVVYGPVPTDVAQTLWEGIQPDALR